jgi:hypothetical protein
MKKSIVVLAVAGLMLVSCAASNPETILAESVQGPKNQNQEQEQAQVQDDHLTINPGDLDGVSLSEAEGILFMREEEKLARDVYLFLAETWGMNIFSNIASSEQSHMDAMLGLVAAAGLDDPAAGAAMGSFVNMDLQALYDELVAFGQQGLSEALLVGGAIEEIDIIDLQEYLAVTEDPAIIEVYQNLLKGSINHLRSFARVYETQTGEAYQPQYLSESEFAELISSEDARGIGSGQSSPAQGRGQGRGRSN